MNRFLLLLTFLISPFVLSAQNISFSFSSPNVPAPNSVWKDTAIDLNVVVYATAQVTTATAAVAGRQINLQNLAGAFRGHLSLQGVPGDTLTLVIAATDAASNTGDTSVTFIFRPLNDPSISLTVAELADSSVARPLFPLHAKCTTAAGSGTINVYNLSDNNQPIASANDSIPVMDLSVYNGTRLKLKLVATDTVGRTAEKLLTVFVESSPYLTPYLTTRGTILDFKDNKALVADSGTGYPLLVNGVTGQRSAPLVNQTLALSSANGNAFVIPGGAMFKYRLDSLYIWKNGQVDLHTKALYTAVSPNGNYATYVTSDAKIVFRNLATGDTTMAPCPRQFFDGNVDVADNGLVVFDAQTGIGPGWLSYKYQNGQVTPLSSPDNIQGAPLTDGTNVVYFSGGPNIYLNNGQSDLLLGSPGDVKLPGAFGSGAPDPSVLAKNADYQVNNKIVAFVRNGQVVVRDTSGVVHEVSAFNYCPSCDNRVRIDLLNDKKELMMSTRDSGRFFVNAAGVRKRITTMPERYTESEGILSRSFYDNGKWYLLIGNTLFTVNTDTTVVTDTTTNIPQPVISGLLATYCGAGDAQQGKIGNPPAPASGITVTASLDDTTNLPVAADSTFSFTPATLSTGTHTVTVTFSKDTLHKEISKTFTVTAAVTPEVAVISNINPIVSDTPVVITATNVSGGGKLPLYTFAWDRNFTDQLQIESSSDHVTVSPAAFKLGDNWVYVRLRTSESCYTAATAIDSIKINRSSITAIVDVDAPGQSIRIYPNPFREQINVYGLQLTRSYIISLYNIQGKLILRQKVVNNTKAQLQVQSASGAIYLLNVYDEKKKKVLGTEKLVGY
ncbi:T9SS type A sorting domain-containing protein [Chitinophaga sp. GbtcB8]|uniref:T9SS type A sorting domain-containing protein n=1 Tax=Chitinophaga sp. GbtcB8 TaxID=2824753 RepID=UPI001C2F4CF3|nr:T9SS type A sorting domain-containing protein [Chitinophaga sp. GbtcB8]